MDLEKLRGETREALADIRGDLKRLETQVRLIIGLIAISAAFFGPVVAKFLALIKQLPPGGTKPRSPSTVFDLGRHDHVHVGVIHDFPEQTRLVGSFRTSGAMPMIVASSLRDPTRYGHFRVWSRPAKPDTPRHRVLPPIPRAGSERPSGRVAKTPAAPPA